MLVTNRSSGIGRPERPVDVAHVAAEQVVELAVVVRVVVVAVPPAPVAAFGDEQFLARRRQRLGAGGAGGVLERAAGARQLAPGAAIVGVADPDVEVGVDPRAGMQAGSRSVGAGAGLGHRHRAQRRVSLQPAVERAQERPSLAFVVLPGVLAVEHDEDGGLFPAAVAAIALAGGGDAVDEVVGRRLRIPGRIGEADEVGQQVIAEARTPRQRPAAPTW